jgi:hypothetical protein
MIIIKTKNNYDHTIGVFILKQYLNLKYYNEIQFSLKWTNKCLSSLV